MCRVELPPGSLILAVANLLDDDGAGNESDRGVAEDRSFVEVTAEDRSASSLPGTLSKASSKAEKRHKIQQAKNEKRCKVQLANAKVHKFQTNAAEVKRNRYLTFQKCREVEAFAATATTVAEEVAGVSGLARIAAAKFQALIEEGALDEVAAAAEEVHMLAVLSEKLVERGRAAGENAEAARKETERFAAKTKASTGHPKACLKVLLLGS
jgi:hypothetical protein